MRYRFGRLINSSRKGFEQINIHPLCIRCFVLCTTAYQKQNQEAIYIPHNYFWYDKKVKETVAASKKTI